MQAYYYSQLKSPDQQIFVTKLSPRKIEAKHAVVLFYPFGQEYMRAHKAFRQLATQLSRNGFDVYRFDYPGTGDSYGTLANMDFETIINDSVKILEHASNSGSYQSIVAVGLRFGALVAHASCSSIDKVKHIVLWDPFASGEHFIIDSKSQLNDILIEDENWNLHGFELTEMFRKSISKYVIQPIEYKKISLALSHHSDNSNTIISIFNHDINTILKGPMNDWNFVDKVGSILLPSELLKHISKYILESTNLVT